MNYITVADLSPEGFVRFGEVGVPLADGRHGQGEVALDLSQGTPRSSTLRLAQRGLAFGFMARHDRVAQCFGAADGPPWLIAVAAADTAAPAPSDNAAFRVPADCFIELAHGIWHLSPYFAEPLRLAAALAFAT